MSADGPRNLGDAEHVEDGDPPRSARAMLVVYLVLNVGGLLYFLVVSLRHA